MPDNLHSCPCGSYLPVVSAWFHNRMLAKKKKKRNNNAPYGNCMTAVCVGGDKSPWPGCTCKHIHSKEIAEPALWFSAQAQRWPGQTGQL